VSARRQRPEAGEGGFALVAVLVVLALLLTVAGEFAQAMRVEGLTTIGFRNAVTARYLAEAAYQRAVAEILPEALAHELDARQLLAFRRLRLTAGEAPAREGLAMGPGLLGYRITDETARLNVNRLAPDVLRRLLDELGVERAIQDVIVDSILDWRDPGEEHRLNGAESAYYLGLPVPHRSKNADLDDVDELAQVRGVTPEILYGRPGSPGLAEYLTVAGPGSVNVNTASPVVLRALGFARAEAELLAGGRPYLDLTALSAPLRRGAQRTRSDLFRIEAWGEVEGRRGPILTALVQRRVERDGGPRAVPLSWRWRAPVP
jgi:type II secretory pathway component PulK